MGDKRWPRGNQALRLDELWPLLWLGTFAISCKSCQWDSRQQWNWSKQWGPRHIFPEVSENDTMHSIWHSDTWCTEMYLRHWQLIRSKLGFYFSCGIALDIDVIFLWRTSFWSIEDKIYKKVERNPFQTFSRKPAKKSKHVCLYTSETHWQFTGILPI